MEVTKQAFRRLGEEDRHEKKEGKEGEAHAGRSTSALAPCSGGHPRSILPGGGGANFTVLTTMASNSESKRSWFGYQ
jgi:hypothetical protein